MRNESCRIHAECNKGEPLICPNSLAMNKNWQKFYLPLVSFCCYDELHRLVTQATCMLCAFTPFHCEHVIYFLFLQFLIIINSYTRTVRKTYTVCIHLFLLYFPSIAERRKGTERELSLALPLPSCWRSFCWFLYFSVFFARSGCEQPKENKNWNTIKV